VLLYALNWHFGLNLKSYQPESGTSIDRHNGFVFGAWCALGGPTLSRVLLSPVTAVATFFSCSHSRDADMAFPRLSYFIPLGSASGCIQSTRPI
jgi:hypothetical protein